MRGSFTDDLEVGSNAPFKDQVQYAEYFRLDFSLPDKA
jgi:hypothetical protein